MPSDLRTPSEGPLVSARTTPAGPRESAPRQQSSQVLWAATIGKDGKEEKKELQLSGGKTEVPRRTVDRRDIIGSIPPADESLLQRITKPDVMMAVRTYQLAEAVEKQAKGFHLPGPRVDGDKVIYTADEYEFRLTYLSPALNDLISAILHLRPGQVLEIEG